MTLKAPPSIVFWRITFPLTLPGVVIGQVLVFLNVMSDFATVATIGGNKHALLSNLVLLFYESSQIRAASVVAVLLMICMLVGVVIALRVVDVRATGSGAMIGWKGRVEPHRLGARHADGDLPRLSVAADLHPGPAVVQRPDRRHDLPHERHVVPLVPGAVARLGHERFQAAVATVGLARRGVFGDDDCACR